MMAGFMGLAEAAARFAAAAVDIEAAKHAALEEACQLVEERAKGLIGHPNASWPPLAPETLKRKDNVNGRRVHEFFEIAHIAAEAFHKVGETASDLLNSRGRGESMNTPAEFLPRVLATVADLALILAHTPRDRQEAFLEEFAANVQAQWREVFAPYMSAKDVDGMVEDVIARVRTKRDQIESAGAGTA